MNTSGRQAELSPDEAIAYAPVAPLAVAALGISVIAAIVIGWSWLAARYSGKPIFEPMILVLPFAGLALAMVSGRHIRGSGGARSGRGLANAALWISISAGGVYLAYLVAVDLAMRNQASQYSLVWFDKAATDTVEAAFLPCLEPATRQPIDEKDVNGIRQRFDNELSVFRNNDILRMIRRCGANFDVKLKGIKDWSIRDGGYYVQQVFDYKCAEGKFEILVSAFGRDMPAMGGRAWQVLIRKSDILSRETTALGRLVMDIQLEARQHLVDWTQLLNADKVHEAFLQTQPLDQREAQRNRRDSAEEKAFQSGSLIQVDGRPPTDEQRKRFGSNAIRGGGINVFPGSVNMRVGAPQVEINSNSVRLIHHVEINLDDIPVPVVAYITAELQGPDLVKEIQRIHDDKNWRAIPTSADHQGLAEIDRFPSRGFRITSIDVRPTEKRLGQSQLGQGA